ncbi:Dihydrolipoyllysine-residue acetyltransferase component of pyruvate dehydrogenase complex, mitochondrial [Hypsizygus marmoreus]|uniref:Acetyltransferase component of pyruvate dehydrogenase complex n=1 Tax=Hypsizygus marmoreus TaxID=39966 RepID=A0A369KCL0_HYPMA|nr:Dihydrolipoyllysine-residue acetyltransferase component of pyruvate dehydrogenase complex, mitochondrial [Hypsizygus marmoreus]
MASAVAARIFTRRFHVSARRNALSRFNMPAMSPTMSEGGIASWKKKEGETFTTGDVLLEIETDKATIDVEAQDDGILAKIIAPDGSKGVQVGAAIAIVGEEGDDISGAAEMASKAASEPSPKEEKAPAPAPATEPSKPSEPLPPKPEPPQAKPPTESRPELPSGERIFASPIAKKIALERGIPLAQIQGSGPSGRIVRADVESYKPAPAAARPPAETISQPPSAQLPDYVDTPISNMRRTIGARLTQSKQELPHYYLTVDINMDKVMKLREVFNRTLTEKDKSAKLSVNDFIVKAASCALVDVPEANSAWLGEVIRTYKKADISVAVATPTGLITPIIKDVGSKGLATISSETKALAKKARDGKLTPAEYQGGTFTISNLGMFGISDFTAIINPPQSCILAVGSTQPTLAPAPEEERGFKTVQIMKVTLSSDHRTVDGAIGARWMSAFKGYMENPLTLML